MAGNQPKVGKLWGKNASEGGPKENSEGRDGERFQKGAEIAMAKPQRSA